MEIINIVAAFDDKFAQHACVMLQSVLDSNPRHRFRFYLLVPEGFSAKRGLTDLNRSNQCEMHLVFVPPKQVAGLKALHYHVAAFYRLLVGELLPPHITRVLYLDCDVLVRGDLRPLWETDLQGCVVAAVKDEIADREPRFKEALNLSCHAVYFNSGVLLVDLVQWREENIGAKVLEWSRANSDRITFPDQCALNGFLQGRHLQLDERWNAQSGLFTRGKSVSEWMGRAVIIHFTATSNKPWVNVRGHPLAPLYLRALRKTLYYTPAAAIRWQWKMLWRRVATVLGSVRRRLPGIVPSQNDSVPK